MNRLADAKASVKTKVAGIFLGTMDGTKWEVAS